MESVPAIYFVCNCIPNSSRGAILRSSTEKPKSLTAKLAKGAKEEKSFTAKDSKDTEEENSLTAKDAKAVKKSIIGTKP